MQNEFKTLLVAISGPVAEVTINRPEKLNALNAQVLDDLRAAVAELRENEDIHAVILTGAGEKAFAAGADIGELAALMNTEHGVDFSRSGQYIFALIESSPMPFIAAVNGFALGGGCELALACHLRICSENAKFAQPEVSLGIIPGYGGTQRLTRIAGRTYAADLILTGRTIDAREAYSAGIVSRVVSQDKLLETAREIATAIASKAPLAIRAAIEAIYSADGDLENGFEQEANLFGRLIETRDFREGTSAFLEKRTATFTGQ
ncbi:MAG TPA: enoyl-CoA hydratase-related protein [Candidatus Kapabacteria bacterium]|nr:enoyl-CoA hydratase-related protein [Candidatus Kapabacteria bacterium]